MKVNFKRMVRVFCILAINLYAVLPAFSESWGDPANVATSFAGGTGDAATPYLITTSQQLAYLAKQVNAGNAYMGKYFKMNADIDLGGKEWVPINEFRGKFDGNNHTISNLTITEGIYQATGLFGRLHPGATISNLNLVGGSIKGWNTNDLLLSYTGSIAGYVRCNTYANIGTGDITITKCSSSVKVDGGFCTFTGGMVGHIEVSTHASIMHPVTQLVTISYCSYTGTVDGGMGFDNNAGGIIGSITTSSSEYGSSKINISCCANTGKIIGRKAFTGGIVGAGGSASGSLTIANCTNSGVIEGNETRAGGLIGYANSVALSLSNCANSGTVSGSNVIGGIAGETYKDVKLNNCYNYSLISGATNAKGGIVGNADKTKVTSCYYLQEGGINKGLKAIGEGTEGTGSTASPLNIEAFKSKNSFSGWSWISTAWTFLEADDSRPWPAGLNQLPGAVFAKVTDGINKYYDGTSDVNSVPANAFQLVSATNGEAIGASVNTDDVTGSYTASDIGSFRVLVGGLQIEGANYVLLNGSLAGIGEISYEPETYLSLDEWAVTMPVGSTKTLVAYVTPSGKTVTWSSNNTTVATVDNTGKITAKTKGEAVITASCGDKTASCGVTVTQPVTSITFSKPEVILNVGAVDFLNITVLPENATRNITWSSSDESVASFPFGFDMLRTYKVGTAIITASADGVSASCKVTVIQPVTGISLDKSQINMDIGNSQKLTATVLPENATNKAVSWYSMDESVAVVSDDGLVTAKKAGTTMIGVSPVNTYYTATCVVTVNAVDIPVTDIPVTGVSISETNVIRQEGNTVQLSANVYPKDAADQTVTWSSSNNSVATVDQTGKVTTIKAGTAIITVRTDDGGKTATCTVTVHELPDNTVFVTSVALQPSTLTLNVGENRMLTATVYPIMATDKTVNWSSSNESVATVANGTVTGISDGTATITVRTNDGNKTATCTVTVMGITHIPVGSIALQPTALTLNVGETSVLSTTISPYNATDQTVTWTSSDESVVMVANGMVTAIRPGKATITVRTNDGQKTATCTVTVTETTTGIDDYEVVLAMVYPNPNDGRFMLNFTEHGTYRISIANISGKVLLRETVTGQSKQMDISNYTNGVYLLMVENGKRKTTIKIVKNQ